MTADRLTADIDRLWADIERSAEIGPGRPGGLRRLALSDSDREMRDLFVAWCAEAGCRVTVDRAGSLFARRAGRDDSLPPVMVGSHLDSQANGGRFDGVLGVLAGLEIVRALNDAGVTTRRPIEVVNWTNEEGARFQPPMVASGGFAGVYDLDFVLGCVDDDGVRLGDALAAIGYAGDAPLGGRPVDAYFELHIEQGPMLDATGLDVGIVTGGYAVKGYTLAVRGETAHSGPTPMEKRRNALVGAAELLVAANDIGWAHRGEDGKGTAARIVAWPNKPGILSDHAEVTVDFRHPDPAGTAAMAAAFEAAVAQAAEKARVEIGVVKSWAYGTEVFDPGLAALLQDAARARGATTLALKSQAGHDAYNMSRVAPTALVFSPCKDGITHHNDELATPERTGPAVQVLLDAVVARADREEA